MKSPSIFVAEIFGLSHNFDCGVTMKSPKMDIYPFRFASQSFMF